MSGVRNAALVQISRSRLPIVNTIGVLQIYGGGCGEFVVPLLTPNCCGFGDGGILNPLRIRAVSAITVLSSFFFFYESGEFIGATRSDSRCNFIPESIGFGEDIGDHNTSKIHDNGFINNPQPVLN